MTTNSYKPYKVKRIVADNISFEKSGTEQAFISMNLNEDITMFGHQVNDGDKAGLKIMCPLTIGDAEVNPSYTVNALATTSSGRVVLQGTITTSSARYKSLRSAADLDQFSWGGVAPTHYKYNFEEGEEPTEVGIIAEEVEQLVTSLNLPTKSFIEYTKVEGEEMVHNFKDRGLIILLISQQRKILERLSAIEAFIAAP